MPTPPPLDHPSPPARISRRYRLVTLGVFCLFFILACGLPVLHVDKGDPVWPGYQVVWAGALGVFIGQFAWFANLFAAGAMICFLAGAKRAAMLLSLIALFISTDTFRLFRQEILLDEAGVNKARLQSLGIGFYFWMAALITPLVAALLAKPKITPETAV